MQFPNAELVISETELDLWNSPDAASSCLNGRPRGAPAAQKLFAALGDRVRPIKGGADVVTGVTVLDTAGHTQGHISLLVGSGDKQLLITGDAVPSIHIAFDRPEWQIKWDHDPEKGRQKRAGPCWTGPQTTGCWLPDTTTRSPELAVWSRKPQVFDGCPPIGSGAAEPPYR